MSRKGKLGCYIVEIPNTLLSLSHLQIIRNTNSGATSQTNWIGTSKDAAQQFFVLTSSPNHSDTSSNLRTTAVRYRIGQKGKRSGSLGSTVNQVNQLADYWGGYWNLMCERVRAWTKSVEIREKGADPITL